MPHPQMRPPAWMPGKDAIAHTLPGHNCSEADAIEQSFERQLFQAW